MAKELVKVTLERTESTDEGTFGRIVLGERVFYTLELPWRDNQSNISCIPLGIYRWVWGFSSRFKRPMYLAIGVENRTGVRIHSANLAGDTERGFKSQLNGCIALGDPIGRLGNQRAILLSAKATREFEQLMDRKPFIMEIKLCSNS